MGCTQSKIENEEAVTRCKERKQFMKDAVVARNAFAAAHSACAMCLKNTGAALSDYAHAEVPSHPAGLPPPTPGTGAASSTPLHPPIPPQSALENFPPPPPPLPSFTTTVPLQRAASMPEMKIPKPEAAKPVAPTIIEEEEAELETDDVEKLVRKRSSRGSSSNRGAVQESNHHHAEQGLQQPRLARGQPAAQLIQHDSTWDYFFPPVESMPGTTLANPEEEEEVERMNGEEVEPPPKVFEEKPRKIEEEPPMVVEERVEKEVEIPVPVAVPEKKPKKGGSDGGRRVNKYVNLAQVFTELDDHFLKASESAHEVSKMLEATRLHYHSNFADNRGHIDHSARVMRVITWNRSFRGVPEVDDGKDDFDSEEHETHATVLDKMLAWEKKLYDEVKAGELMKFEYQKKVNSLNKQKKKSTNSDSLEKLKASVSHLHTRYIVDMQSMDSTVSEINRLRDEQLYPKLVQLVEGMTTMWDTMRFHHDAQFKIVTTSLRYWDISQSPLETSEHHHDRTMQLLAVVQDWHVQFCRLIDNQKGYINAMNQWLKLNLIPIESNLREKVSSPPRVENPPIQALLISWNDSLHTLPDEVARTAINNFGAVIHTIFQYQEDEMKLKYRCEETRKELTRKTRQFEDWKSKYLQKRIPDEFDPERAEGNTQDEAVAERQFAVDALAKRLEEEEEAFRKQSLQVREKSLASLRTRLPDLFRALTDISRACAEMYRNLSNIAQHQSQRRSSS